MSACSTLPSEVENQFSNSSANSNSNVNSNTNTNINNQQADVECQNHAQNIANHAETIASSAQYLTAAKAMKRCISSALQNRQYNPSDQHDNVIMKMMATATLNFIKSGDVITASREVDRFKRIYPNKDLYFDDYTSFLDTATALLSLDSLHSSELSVLNISPVLRDEIERKHYWLNH
jgi:hypothetical protein